MGRMVNPINPVHPLIRRILMQTKEQLGSQLVYDLLQVS